MELTVQIMSFGSAWWVRPGSDKLDPQRYAQHAAYFNSTGIEAGSKIHTAGPVHGVVRFNATSGLNPHRTHDNIGAVFSFTEIDKYRDTNRLLALRRIPDDAEPTHFLVRIQSSVYGTVPLNRKWRSSDVGIIAISRYRGQQELLLLLTAKSVLNTSLGRWMLSCDKAYLPRLVLIDEEAKQPCDI